MKVSPDNKSIWVCSATENDTLNGYSGIFNFDLKTGKLIEKYMLDNKAGPHFFNDLVITKTGEIYFTDSKGGKVLHLNRKNKTITPFVANDFIYPNGIALDETNGYVFVADFTGITRINLQDRELHQLDVQGKTYLNGIDGLYFYKNSLLAIQDSGNGDDRIVRFYLDKSGQQITRTEVLQSFHPDFNIPTTGVIVANEFYYISNSQLRNLQPDGTLTQPETLKKPLIKKIKVQ
jgi:DNA-binding beta-propeller fold protein YncE